MKVLMEYFFFFGVWKFLLIIYFLIVCIVIDVDGDYIYFLNLVNGCYGIR